MKEVQRLAKSHFRHYCKYRAEGESHAVYMVSNDIDIDSDVSRLLNDMYEVWVNDGRAMFYRKYPFILPRLRKTVANRQMIRKGDKEYEAFFEDICSLIRRFKLGENARGRK